MSHLNEHIKHPANESKRKLDESEGDNQKKSLEGGTSQSLVFLWSNNGKAVEKLSAQVKGLLFFLFTSTMHIKHIGVLP